jgi:hypothetical protein
MLATDVVMVAYRQKSDVSVFGFTADFFYVEFAVGSFAMDVQVNFQEATLPLFFAYDEPFVYLIVACINGVMDDFEGWIFFLNGFDVYWFEFSFIC